MKNEHIAILAVALVLIIAGVWYPSIHQAQREHEAKAEAKEALRRMVLLQAWEVVKNRNGIWVSDNSAQRTIEALDCTTAYQALAKLESKLQAKDKVLIETLHDAFAEAAHALSEPFGTDDEVLEMVKAVKAAEEKFRDAQFKLDYATKDWQ